TITLSAAAGALQPATRQLIGAVNGNPAAPPTLVPGGILHIEYTAAQAAALGGGLAPGNVAQVYGTGLAGGPASPSGAPLPDILNGTFMLIGGVQIPLYYVSAGQLDVQVPFELSADAQYSAVVSANGALTVPQ